MRLVAIAYVLLAILMFSVTYPFLLAASETFPAEADLATALGLLSAAVTATSFLVSIVLRQPGLRPRRRGRGGPAAADRVPRRLQPVARRLLVRHRGARPVHPAGQPARHLECRLERVLQRGPDRASGPGPRLQRRRAQASSGRCCRASSCWRLGHVARARPGVLARRRHGQPVCRRRPRHPAALRGERAAHAPWRARRAGPRRRPRARRADRGSGGGGHLVDRAPYRRAVGALHGGGPARAIVGRGCRRRAGGRRRRRSGCDACASPRSRRSPGSAARRPPPRRQASLGDADPRVREAAVRALGAVVDDPRAFAAIPSWSTLRPTRARPCAPPWPGCTGRTASRPTASRIFAELLGSDEATDRVAGLAADSPAAAPDPERWHPRASWPTHRPGSVPRRSRRWPRPASWDLIRTAVVAALDDDAAAVRGSAATALAGRDRATPGVLRRPARHGSPRAQDAALGALDGHGPEVRETVIALGDRPARAGGRPAPGAPGGRAARRGDRPTIRRRRSPSCAPSSTGASSGPRT